MTTSKIVRGMAAPLTSGTSPPYGKRRRDISRKKGRPPAFSNMRTHDEYEQAFARRPSAHAELDLKWATQ